MTDQREIKYQAWDKENKIMLLWEDSASEICEAISEKNKYFEIRQYTGLRDKNGVEIYEGDIVEYFSIVINRKLKGDVFWHDKLATWFIKNEFGTLEHFALTMNNPDFKKIGNIYENPELLLGENSPTTKENK